DPYYPGSVKGRFT
nr:immunoglobulin heavy chain junction region [Homo sapiens]